MSDTIAEYSGESLHTQPERVQDPERERVIGLMAELATRLQDTTQNEKNIRQGDEDVVRMLGHWANQIVTVLDDDTWKSDAEIILLIPRTHETEEIQEIEEVSVRPISKKALRWLEGDLGENWREKLNVTEDASFEEISEAILSSVTIDPPNTIERSTARIMGRLKGLTASQIAAELPGDSAAKIGAYFAHVLKRVRIVQSKVLEQAEKQAVEVEPVANMVPRSLPEKLASNDISKKGLDWLINGLGENWREKLGLDSEASIGAIAAAIVDRVVVRQPNTRERSIQFIEGRLKGKAASLIAMEMSGENMQNVGMFLAKVLSRIPDESKPSVVARPKPSSLRSAPARVTTIKITDKYDDEEEFEEIKLDREPIQKQPKYEKLPEVNQETVSLLVAEHIGLTAIGRIELASFLDPVSHAMLTANKRKVVEAVRDAIRDKIDDEKYELSESERVWVRRCFGAYMRQNVLADQPPYSVMELTKPSGPSGRNTDVAGHVYGGLTKIFK